MRFADEIFKRRSLHRDWKDMIVIVSGTSWDDTWLSEKHLAIHLSKHVPTLFVDPPVSWLTPLRKPQLSDTVRGARLRPLHERLARLTPLAPPGISRPVLRQAALAATRRAIRKAIEHLDGSVDTLIVCSLDPLFNSCDAKRRVLYGTDDWVAGGSLMGISESWLRTQEKRQLNSADTVVTVSASLAKVWQQRDPSLTTMVIPNGCDFDAFSNLNDVELPSDVDLPRPIAGFIGHLSERIDTDLLTAAADTGHSLLLVGSRQLTFDIGKFDRLLERANVQWVGPKPFERLPSYMKIIDVGLTPYVDSEFNRSSHPLKTLEYLAAGREAIVTDLPSSHSIPKGLATICGSTGDFKRAVDHALSVAPDPELVSRRVAFARSQSWEARAQDFLRLLNLGTAA